MASWILESLQYKVTLSGGSDYDIINDFEENPAIPQAYHRISFLNQTGSSLKVKVNNADDYETIPDNASYDHGEAKQETPWKDVVKVNGTGSIIVFISYWKYV